MADSPAIEDLLAEARYHRHRYDLYRAKMTSFASATAAGRAAADVHLNAGSAPAPEDDPVLVSAASGLG